MMTNTTKKSTMKAMAKNNPMRKCVGCNTMNAKTSMIRIAKDESKEFVVDETQKLQSRGAYICRNRECIKKALKNKGLERSLKCKLSEDLYDKIERVAERI